MKIDSSFAAVVNARQSKPAKESKAVDAKKLERGAAEDNVDVTAQSYSTQAAPAASYSEASDLMQNIDYQKAVDAHSILKETAFQLASLSQT